MQSKYLKFQYLGVILGLISLVLVACGGTTTASSSQSEMITIGIVNQFIFFEGVIDGFKAKMTESGFVEGEDITYIYTAPVELNREATQQEIQSLLDQDVDLFLTIGSSPSGAVNAILEENDLNAVFALVTNPEKQNLVETLTSPNGRITGVNIGGPIIRKSLEWLLTVVPDHKRVHVFYAQGDILTLPQLEDIQTTTDELNTELVLHEVATVEEASEIVATLSPEDDVIFNVAAQLPSDYLQVAIENNIPVGTSTLATEGMVTSINLDLAEMGGQSALLSQQILRGADPGTLPVEPAQYTLLLNLEYAESIGIEIPDSIVQQAGEVISVMPATEATEEADGS